MPTNIKLKITSSASYVYVDLPPCLLSTNGIRLYILFCKLHFLINSYPEYLHNRRSNISLVSSDTPTDLFQKLVCWLGFKQGVYISFLSLPGLSLNLLPSFMTLTWSEKLGQLSYRMSHLLDFSVCHVW